MTGKIHKQGTLHLMLLPSVILLLVYSYFPMFGLIMAFQRFRATQGFFRSAWVGLDNFRTLFMNPAFSSALRNTVFIASMKIVLGMLVPLIFSLLLNEVRKNLIKRSIQTIVYLPYFISWVLMAGILIDILSPSSGMVNRFLVALNINPVFFLGNNRWFPYVLVATDVWKSFGWGTIIFLAALTGINPELYEASIIDGAGRWKQTIHITLPGILSMVILVATLSLGSILNAGFDQVFNLLTSITIPSGDIIDTLVYRMGIERAQFSMATATGLFKSVVSFVLITTSYKLAYKYAGYRIF